MSVAELPPRASEDIDASDLDGLFLRSVEPPPLDDDGIGIVDLFSGCGGLTLGALEAFRRAAIPASLRLAVDDWEPALTVLSDSLRVGLDRTMSLDLAGLLDDAEVSTAADLRDAAGPGVGLLLAGPPCQGHSALNNHSRHDDDRNRLYLAVAEATRVLRPAAVIIENVRGVVADRAGTMRRCFEILDEDLDYHVVEALLDLQLLGAPQSRRRHVVIACREGSFDPACLHDGLASPRSVDWAIGDLAGRPGRTVANTASIPTPDNERRLRWLGDNMQKTDLPDSERPKCHRDGPHSYRSMYGRLSWDKPAQTITSGYGSMGQGRFVHPDGRRTLTPREAARLQMLPDFMEFENVVHRSTLATMIGNAAPPVLSLRVVAAMLDQGLLGSA